MSAIGIDLGTTNCCVGVIKHGKLQIVPNKLGHRTTPSIVCFRGDEVLIGETAKKYLIKSPASTVYNIKYLIGRKWTEPKIEAYCDQVPFTICTRKNRLMIGVPNEDNQNIYYTPEEISGLLLSELKRNSEAYLDCKVNKAVITVPTYFNDSQRQATIDAGKIAGFTEIKLLNEPTAAALAYGEENPAKTKRNILVYDFGGGTFDVSVIKYENGTYEVLAIDGNLQLGGEDVNDIILVHYQRKLKKEHGIDISRDRRKIARLKEICEKIKKDLSDQLITEVELDAFKGEEIIDYQISRSEFDSLNRHIFESTVTIVSDCMKRSGLTKNDIDEIVLVGGSTRNAKIVSLLTKMFQKDVKRSINADEAVAYGAAITAAKWNQQYCNDINFINKNAYSLGVETVGGRMTVIIPKFSKLPIKKAKKFQTISDDQTNINIKIYAGDDEYTRHNKLLGDFQVTGIASGPKGRILEETFEVNEDGILKVIAVDLSGHSAQLTVNVEKGTLTDDNIRDMKQNIDNVMRKSLIIQEKQQKKGVSYRS